MAETEQTTATTPAVAYEYIWFGGQPVAQFDAATNTPHWAFTDHLGTPILQTNASGAIDWRAEYEPYGTVNTLRAGATRHQPLRFPGQEYDEASADREYNIFRWYRGGWGRYTQSDRLRLRPVRYGRALLPADNPYAYARVNTLTFSDPLGLQPKPTADCNFSRYKLCCSDGAILKWCCKKYVDFACTGEKNVVCCQTEYETCRLCKDPEDPTFQTHQAKCQTYLNLCVAGLAKAECPE